MLPRSLQRLVAGDRNPFPLRLWLSVVFRGLIFPACFHHWTPSLSSSKSLLIVPKTTYESLCMSRSTVLLEPVQDQVPDTESILVLTPSIVAVVIKQIIGPQQVASLSA